MDKSGKELQGEQLRFDITPPLLVWVARDSESIPAVTGDGIRCFSQAHTGNSNLGTRIVNSIEKALGHNGYHKPDPESYAVSDVFAVLKEARENPDSRPFWFLGAMSMGLFQELCKELRVELATK
jgi:hypothetical protein